MAYDSFYNRNSRKISSIDDDFGAYGMQKSRNNNESFSRNYSKVEQAGLDPSFGRKYPFEEDHEINQFRKPVKNNRYPSAPKQEDVDYRKPSNVANTNPREQESDRYDSRAEDNFNKKSEFEEEQQFRSKAQRKRSLKVQQDENMSIEEKIEALETEKKNAVKYMILMIFICFFGTVILVGAGFYLAIYKGYATMATI